MDEAFTRTITLDIEGIKGLTLLGEVIRSLEQHNNNFFVGVRLGYGRKHFYGVTRTLDTLVVRYFLCHYLLFIQPHIQVI